MPKYYKKHVSSPSYNSVKKKKISRDDKNGFSQNGFEFWGLYFNDDDIIEHESTVMKIKAFLNYIISNNYNLSEIEDVRVFIVDLNHLQANQEFISGWDNFKEDLVNRTEYCLNCMALAMHETSFKQNPLDTSHLDNDETGCPIIPIIPRLSNHEPIRSIRHLKGNDYGTLVSVRGTVIRASNVKLICDSIEFICSCGETQVVKQPDNVFTLPSTTCKCRKVSSFQPQLNSNVTQTIHSQTIKIQELMNLDSSEGGRVPQTLECELVNDLVSSCVPGDEVTVTGIIKVHSNEEVNNKNKQASLFMQYLHTISIINNKNQVQAIGSSGSMQFTSKDYHAIQKIHAEPNLFRFLVQSLCPSIYGHEIIKAGLLLALFGGTDIRKESSHRADSHVLMVGDPGLGKSQMLQACTNVAPKGVYVCGNMSTNSGLTVTMCRETGGEYVLEAGALVLGDQGICCIDEFDKMTAQHECLLEAMEQQTISIAKAGVNCRLPARTTILAAANPVGGHYNKAITVSENLKMGSALLSRFDLVFILLDQPDEKLDSLLSEHVLALHCGRKQSLSQSIILNDSITEHNDGHLRDRLKVCADEPPLSLLPHVLFRKFIAYAKQYVHPKLSPEANQILKQFYLELRRQYQTGDSTPVTTRQLESLKRLTQARAKLELRELATEQDALDVIEVLRHSLIDVFSDEFGTLDFRRSQNGSGMSSRNQVKGLISILQMKAEKETRSIFNVKELQEAAERMGIGRGKFGTVMQTLNIQGFLLKKGPDMYQLQSVDF